MRDTMMDTGCHARITTVTTNDKAWAFVMKVTGDTENTTLTYRTDDQEKADYLMAAMLNRMPLKIMLEPVRVMVRKETEVDRE